MNNLFLVHGAFSSTNAFNYLVDKLDLTQINEVIRYEYDITQTKISTILLEIESILSSRKIPSIMVGHSLGGVISLAMHHHRYVKKVLTVASPISGIRVNKLVEMLLVYRCPYLGDIMTDSSFMYSLRKDVYEKEINMLITNTGYNPMIVEKNDGVVTLASQTSWYPETAKLKYVNSNHHEILQTQSFVDAVNESLEV